MNAKYPKTRAETPPDILDAMDHWEQQGNAPFIPVGFAKMFPQAHVHTGKGVVYLMRGGKMDDDFVTTLFKHLREGLTVCMAFESGPDMDMFGGWMNSAMRRAPGEVIQVPS